MKSRDIGPAHICEYLLEDIEAVEADIVRYKKLEEDFFANFTAIAAHGHRDRLSYKDMLLAKEMFKKGYMAAHVKGDLY